MKVALSIILIFSILSCLTIPVYAFPNINTISSETEPAEDSAGCSNSGYEAVFAIPFIIAAGLLFFSYFYGDDDDKKRALICLGGIAGFLAAMLASHLIGCIRQL